MAQGVEGEEEAKEREEEKFLNCHQQVTLLGFWKQKSLLLKIPAKNQVKALHKAPQLKIILHL